MSSVRARSANQPHMVATGNRNRCSNFDVWSELSELVEKWARRLPVAVGRHSTGLLQRPSKSGQWDELYAERSTNGGGL